MNHIKIRQKILQKISQTAASPAAIEALPPFEASAAFPNIMKLFAGFTYINQLINQLHIALHYDTGGKVNFKTMKDAQFNINADQYPSPDQKNLINLSKKIYQNLLNINANKLSKDQIDSIINNLIISPEVNNLSSINPAGPIGQKISGNLKTNIIEFLKRIANAGPAT